MADHWEVKEILDPVTGEVDRLYSYKRKRCKRVALDSKLAKQLAGYTLIEKDLRSIGGWLKEIGDRHIETRKREGDTFGRSGDRERYNLIKGLFVASLTFYGKCFASCEGRRVKLDRSMLEDRYRDKHDEVLAYRHNFAAHSGAEKLEEVTIALVFPLTRYEVPKIYHELRQPDLI